MYGAIPVPSLIQRRVPWDGVLIAVSKKNVERGF